VFVLPLDRQNKRDPRADLFTFDDGLGELRDIVNCSDESARVAKHKTTPEERTEWWATRRALDERMKTLVDNVEYCWLGAFKVCLPPWSTQVEGEPVLMSIDDL
jgi:separase